MELPDGIKSVVFDLDGTLYDNRWFAVHIVFAELTRLQTLRSERKARSELKGQDFVTETACYEALFGRMAQIRGCRNPGAMAKWYQNQYMSAQAYILARHYTPRPCVQELLEALQGGGVRTYVFSDYGSVDAKLLALNINPKWFNETLSAPEVGGLKPCRSAFARMLDRFGCNPETTLMVGDREDTDGDGARSVGMPFYNVKATPDAWDRLLHHFLFHA